MHILEIINLTAYVGDKKILDNISLSLEEGETCVIMGIEDLGIDLCGIGGSPPVVDRRFIGRTGDLGVIGSIPEEIVLLYRMGVIRQNDTDTIPSDVIPG